MGLGAESEWSANVAVSEAILSLFHHFFLYFCIFGRMEAWKLLESNLSLVVGAFSFFYLT